MVTKLGQLTWPFSSLQFCTLFSFFCWKYTELYFFLEKLIGQWIPDRDGRGITRDIKKIISILKTWQNIITKFGQFKKLKYPNFVNCSNFVTIFCRVLKIKKYIFIFILAIPRQSRFGIHWPINFSKKVDNFVYFQQQQKSPKLKRKEGSRDPSLLLSFAFFFWKYTESSIIWGKKIGQWIPDRNGRGIAGDIKKKIIFIFKTRQKMVTKLGQFYKVGTFQLFIICDFLFCFCCRESEVPNQ